MSAALVRVTLPAGPAACFGVLVADAVVIGAAPLGRWMVGHPADRCRGWVERRGGTWELVRTAD